MQVELHLDDIVALKKPHPCGSSEWKVTRIGADIRLECCGCGRRLLLPRREVQKRIKKVLTPGDEHGCD